MRPVAHDQNSGIAILARALAILCAFVIVAVFFVMIATIVTLTSEGRYLLATAVGTPTLVALAFLCASGEGS